MTMTMETGCCATSPAPDAPGTPGEITALDEELALMGKALGHPARLAILRHLAGVQGCVCGRIVEVLPLAQSTVSQHLKILKQSGLVRGRVEGPRTCYCLDREKLARFEELLAGLLPHGDDHGHA